LERLYYTATQSGRVAWYLAQYALSARLASPLPRRAERYSVPLPSLGTLLADLRRTFADEWRDLAAGAYRAPYDALRPPHEVVGESLAFFGDFFAVDRRRRQGSAQEAVALAHGEPRYYTQNFHFQTDGYLSRRSARLYDVQVETLFLGGGDLMRRRALPILAELGQRPARLLDIGCGTGRLLGFVADSFPAIERIGLDLSRAYLDEAGRQLRRWPGTRLVEANAEKIPLDASEVDVVTAVFLFHELPHAARRRVLGEVARVLKPGGLFVLIDSLQKGDYPAYDGLLEFFPHAFHEPYFADYVTDDLAGLGAGAGLGLESSTRAFLAKVALFRKPD
jgi:ubiquinone/menaquinone biosynthesis C-methylase UbiE